MLLGALDLRDVAETVEDRVFALRSIGRAYGLIGDQERALNALEEAVRIVDETVEKTTLAQVYRDTAGIMGEVGRYDRSLELVDRGLAVLDPDARGVLRGEFEILRGSNLAALGRIDEALPILEAAAADYPQVNERQRHKLLNNIAMIHKLTGDLDRALGDFEKLLNIAEETEDLQLAVYALLELGDINRILENPTAARRYLDDALVRSERANNATWQHFAHGYLRQLAEAQADPEAMAFHEEAAATLEATMRREAIENQARVLDVTMEVMERDNRIAVLQLEKELQAVRLDRSRKLFWLAGLATALLLVALWLAMQQVRIRAAANRKLEDLANTDTLTRLSNRRYLVRHTRETLRTSNKGGTLLLIDLDRFKAINDRHGHDHGDAVLVEIARRIRQIVRGDDVIARWGGEEFLAFLPECDLEKAEEIAERIRAAIVDDPIVHENVAHSVTATIGVSQISATEGFDPALGRADEALYAGKRAGRNQVMLADAR
ncbi:MAG: GGDEF domain-containing protein [Pseudomonadota bacterium]